MKILCVDDEVNILHALRHMLQTAGHETLIAPSAREGLAILARDDTLSLVISGYRMPQINGVAFLRAVRHNWPETGRVLLTGFGDVQEVKAAVADGVIQRLLDKPWQDDELLAIVAQRLGPLAPGSLFPLSI